MDKEEKMKLAGRVIAFFQTSRNLTDGQISNITNKIVEADDEKLEVWVDLDKKIDDYREKKIRGTINEVRNRRFNKIMEWKGKVVANRGIEISLDGLTYSIDDFLDKQLEELFGE